MTDELEQMETPLEEPEAAEPVVAEPEVEAQEPEEYEPSWLNEPVDSQPQYSPEQVAAYNRQMAAMHQQQQYPQQYQQQYQQPGPQEGSLDRFVRDPEGWSREVARREAEAVAYQAIAQSMGPMNAQMNAYMESQLAMQTNEADSSIRKMYKEKFNKDEVFAGNKRIQSEVDRTLRGLRYEAEAQARRGNPRGLLMFQQPGFAEVPLAAVKAAAGIKSAGTKASAPYTERTSPTARPDSGVEIDPDTAEALRSRFGEAYLERYKKAVAAEAKAGR